MTTDPVPTIGYVQGRNGLWDIIGGQLDLVTFNAFMELLGVTDGKATLAASDADVRHRTGGLKQ